MHHGDSEFEDFGCACNALRKASRAVTRFYDSVLEGTGLSLAQYAVLSNVGRHESLPLMQLARSLVMDRTTLYRALKPLDREGWIEIENVGGRVKTARLTDKGRKAVGDAAEAWRDAQARLLGGFGIERWKGVEAALGALVSISREEMR